MPLPANREPRCRRARQRVNKLGGKQASCRTAHRRCLVECARRAIGSGNDRSRCGMIDRGCDHAQLDPLAGRGCRGRGRRAAGKGLTEEGLKLRRSRGRFALGGKESTEPGQPQVSIETGGLHGEGGARSSLSSGRGPSHLLPSHECGPRGSLALPPHDEVEGSRFREQINVAIAAFRRTNHPERTTGRSEYDPAGGDRSPHHLTSADAERDSAVHVSGQHWRRTSNRLA